MEPLTEVSNVETDLLCLEEWGRNKASWKGTYSNIDLEKTVEARDIRYYLIIEILEIDSGLKEVPSFIPESWLCTGENINEKKFYLYPPKSLIDQKGDAIDWANKVFAHYLYPKSTWGEYDISKFAIDKPKNYKSIKANYKSIMTGKAATDLTDSDIPMGKFRKRRHDQMLGGTKAAKENGARKDEHRSPSKSQRSSTPPVSTVNMPEINEKEHRDPSMSPPSTAPAVVSVSTNGGEPNSPSSLPPVTTPPAVNANTPQTNVGEQGSSKSPPMTTPAVTVIMSSTNGEEPTTPSSLPPITTPPATIVNTPKTNVEEQGSSKSPPMTTPTVTVTIPSTKEREPESPSSLSPVITTLVANVNPPKTNEVEEEHGTSSESPPMTEPPAVTVNMASTSGREPENLSNHPPMTNLNSPARTCLNVINTNGETSDDGTNPLLNVLAFWNPRNPIQPVPEALLEDGSNSSLTELSGNRSILTSTPSSSQGNSISLPCDRCGCIGHLEQLKQLEAKIDANHNSLLAAIQNIGTGGNQQQNESLDVRSNPQASALSLIGYHRIIFAQQFTELPFKTVEKLVALNTVLQDNNLAVTVIAFCSAEFRTSGSCNAFVRAMYEHFVTDELSEQLQWKSGDRGTDKRQGLNCLINFVASIGVAVNKYVTSRNDNALLPSKIITLVKAARKDGGKRYRETSDALPKRILEQRRKEAVPCYTPTVKMTDKEIRLQLDKKLEEFQRAIDSFRLPQH